MFIRDRRTYAADGTGGSGGGGDAGGGAGGASGGGPAPGGVSGDLLGGGAGGGGNSPAWYEGKVDAAHIGVWDLKGWDKSDPAKIAAELTRSYQEAERFIGAPAAELIRLKPNDPDAAKALWARLGVPGEAAGYDFAEVKFADGTPLEQSFVDTMRAAFHGANVPKDAAAKVAGEVVKYMEAAESRETTERTVKLDAEKAELARNWGPNAEANRFVARQAAAALKVTEAELDALANVVGGAKVMEMFRQIGARLGEDRFIQNGNANGGSGGLMTREAAVAKRSELMRDKGWSERYLNGDVAAQREMSGLLTLIHGDDTRDSRGM